MCVCGGGRVGGFPQECWVGGGGGGESSSQWSHSIGHFMEVGGGVNASLHKS